MLNKLKIKTYNFLRRTEKFFKTDMVYLAHGGFWLTFGQIVSAGSSFLLAIAFANLLPKETYGIYKYILSVAVILAIPTLSGMNTAIVQATARGLEGSFIPALKTKIRWGLLGGLASLILAGYYYFNGNTTLTISFLISAVFLPFMDSFGLYNSLLQGRKLFKISTQYAILSQIIAIISLITALFFTKNLFLILLAYFLPWTLMRFIFLKITLKKFSPNVQKDPQTLSYGKHLSFMGVISTIASQIDKVLIFHCLGATEVAIYSMAIAPVEQIKNFFRNIGTLALPKFAHKTKEEIKTTVTGKMLRLAMVLLLVTAIYVIFASLIFKLIFPQYRESIFFSQIFAISLISIPVFIPYSALQAKMAQRELYLFNFLFSIFQIGILFLGTYFYDLTGAIVAQVITRFFSLFLISFLLKKLS